MTHLDQSLITAQSIGYQAITENEERLTTNALHQLLGDEIHNAVWMLNG